MMSLEYPENAHLKIIQQRKKNFYIGQWKLTTKTYKELWIKYMKENPDYPVSWGSFTYLRSFYVQSANTKDIEVCCCKVHVEAQRSIDAFIKLCQEQTINIHDIQNYETFFEYLQTVCDTTDESSYVDWKCTPDKNTTCEQIKKRWEELSQEAIRKSDPDVTVPLICFVKTKYTQKSGKESERLEQHMIHVNLKQAAEDFIDDQLAKIIHHRNLRKNYRMNINDIRQPEWGMDRH
jgi:hypothetical protein